MNMTVTEAYELPKGTFIRLHLPQGGFASIQGIFCLEHGDTGQVVGHCKVPILFQGEQKIIEKIVILFPNMGGLRLLLSAEEIAECFVLLDSTSQTIN